MSNNQIPNRPRYEQSSIAKGAYWAHQASSLAFELVFPALIGAGVDWYFGVAPWGIVVGGVIGFGLLMTHLVQMAKKSAADLDRQYPARSPAEGGSSGGESSRGQSVPGGGSSERSLSGQKPNDQTSSDQSAGT